MKDMRSSRLHGRRRAKAVQLSGAAVLVAVTVAVPSLALGTSLFESTDGNLIVNSTGAQDWSNAPNLVPIPDKTSGRNDDSIGASKMDDPVPKIVTGGIPPQKDDITSFYVASDSVGSDAFVYVGFIRSNSLGSAHENFIFAQKGTDSGNGVTPVRTDGDVMLTMDFTSGGDKATLKAYRWNNLGPCAEARAAPCWGGFNGSATPKDLSAAGFADGSVNDGVLGRSGAIAQADNPLTNVALPLNTFGEAAVNLSAAGLFPPGECSGFGRAYMISRSSGNSFNSDLKDLVAPGVVNINTCKPLKVKVKKTDPDGNPLTGATFQLYKDVDQDGVLDVSNPPAGTDDVLLGSCTVTNATTGACDLPTQTGTGTVYFIVHESAAPSGYLPAPDQAFSHTFTSAEVTKELTFKDSPSPVTISIVKKDEAGNPVKDAVLTLYQDVGGTAFANGETAPDAADNPAVDKDTNHPLQTCTTNALGTCSFPTDVTPPGDFWVVETTTPAGYDTATPKPLHVTVGGGNQTVNMTDPRQHRVIVIVCHEGKVDLAKSKVTVNGTTKDSISSSPIAGVTDAQLCGMGGASFGQLGHGSTLGGTDTTATVDVASGSTH